jgi:WD40 repeat protein
VILLNVALAAGRVAVVDVDSPQQMLWEGDRIVVIESGGDAVVVNADTLTVERRVRLDRWPAPAALSENGQVLLVPGQKTRAWDLDSGEVVYQRKDRWGAPAIGLTADGTGIILGQDELEVISIADGSSTSISGTCCFGQVGENNGVVWGMSYGTVVTSESTFVVSDSVWTVAALEDGLALQSGGSAQLLDLESGELSWVAPPGQGGMGSGLTFSPDGRWVSWNASSSGLQTWDLRMQRPGPTLGAGTASAVAWSPDSKRVAFVGWDGVMEVHEISGDADIRGQPLLAGFSGEYAVAAYATGDVVVFRETEDGYRLHRHILLPLDSAWEADRTVVLSPDGTLLGISSHGSMETWDLSTGAAIAPALPAMRNDSDVALGDDGSVAVRAGSWVSTYDADRRLVGRLPSGQARIAVGHGGRWLAVQNGSGVVVYDTLTAESVAVLHKPGLYTDLVFEGDDLLLVHDANLLRWDLENDPVIAYLDDDYASHADISGGRLLTMTGDGRMEHDEVEVQVPYSNGAIDIGLHPEKPLAIRADDRGRIELIDLVTGEVTSLRGKPGGMGGAASFDGRWAVVEGSAIRLDSGEVLQASSAIRSVAMTELGAVGGTQDGSLVRWSQGEAIEVNVSESAITELTWRANTLLAMDEYGIVSAYDATLNPRPVPYVYARSIALSPQGDPVYGQGWQTPATLVDGEWEQPRTARRHRRRTSGVVAVCADGTRIATTENWRNPGRLLTGQGRMKPVDTGVGGVVRVACEQDLAMATWSGLVAVVDPQTGERQTVIAGDGSEVTGLAWVDPEHLLVVWASGEVAVVDL